MSTTTRYKPTKIVFQIEKMSCVVLTLTHNRKGFQVILKVPGVNPATNVFKTEDEAKGDFKRQFTTWAVKAAEAGFPLEYVREKTGRMLPCSGEAHKNIHIDHCMVCLGGTWGQVEELAPIDLEAAKAARLDVPMPSLSDAEFHKMQGKIATGEAAGVDVRRGNSWYSVYRWTGK